MDIERICEDQDGNWQRNFRKPVEDYVEEHCWLKEDPKALITLIENEVRLYEKVGIRRDPEHYVRLFPKHAEAIFRFFELDETWTQADAEEESDPEVTTIHIFGTLELGEELDRGGMGAVYRGTRHPGTQDLLREPVALKVMTIGPPAKPADVKRFLNEIRLLSGLDHPNIVPVLGSGKDQRRHWFSMRLLEGRNLAEIIEQDGPLSPIDAARHVKIVAEAIDYAHRKKVCHRDLKPGNIVIVQKGQKDERLYLVDFGLAKITGTMASWGGTPSFMDPHKVDKELAPADPATANWSLPGVWTEPWRCTTCGSWSRRRQCRE